MTIASVIICVFKYILLGLGGGALVIFLLFATQEFANWLRKNINK